MEWLDRIREFIQQFLSSEMFQKVIAILQKAIEIIQKIWEWLYGTVKGWF